MIRKALFWLLGFVVIFAAGFAVYLLIPVAWIAWPLVFVVAVVLAVVLRRMSDRIFK